MFSGFIGRAEAGPFETVRFVGKTLIGEGESSPIAVYSDGFWQITEHESYARIDITGPLVIVLAAPEDGTGERAYLHSRVWAADGTLFVPAKMMVRLDKDCWRDIASWKRFREVHIKAI